MPITPQSLLPPRAMHEVATVHGNSRRAHSPLPAHHCAHITAVFAWQRQKEMEIADCATIAALENVSIEYAP